MSDSSTDSELAVDGPGFSYMFPERISKIDKIMNNSNNDKCSIPLIFR